jgi:4'-phosphopantetheinyl transferase
MPIEKLVKNERRAWALWKITESEETITAGLSLPEEVPGNISNGYKRLEWLAGRLLTQTLLDAFGSQYRGIVKDEHGKPSLRDYPFELSLSHSYPYVAAILDLDEPVGIDVEQPKEKLLRVGPRILSPVEIEDAGRNLIKNCIYWCSKETLIKIYGKKDLILAENLLISGFHLNNEGLITGRIIVNRKERIIPLYYRVFPDFVLVFNAPTGQTTTDH